MACALGDSKLNKLYKFRLEGIQQSTIITTLTILVVLFKFVNFVIFNFGQGENWWSAHPLRVDFRRWCAFRFSSKTFFC
jgi:hypothetical protein